MRSKKALLNIIFSLGYEIVALVCGLITPRLILSTFGSDVNGVISSITQFLGMITILRMGVAGATRVELYKTIANNDNVGTSGIVRATEKYMRKISAVFVIYMLALGVVYPYISNNEISNLGNFALVLIIGIGTFAEFCFGFTYSCLLDADQRGYVYSILRIASTILNTVIAFVLIKIGSSVYAVKLGSSICFAAVPVVMSIYVRRKYKIDKKVVPAPNALKQKNSVMMHSLANMVHQKASVIILTVFTLAKNISVYNVYNLVVGNLRLLMHSFTNGLEAAFGNMWVKGETENIKRSFSSYEFLMHSFVSVIFSCVGLLIVPFVMIYTHGVTDVNYQRIGFAVALTVTEGIYCIREPYVTLVQAAGKYKETRRDAVIEACINLVVSIVLVNFLDITGVVIGMMVANLYRTIAYAVFISKNVIKFKFINVLARILWTASNVGIIVLLANLFLDFGSVTSWGTWLIYGVICFAISMIVTVISGLIFYKKDFMNAIRFVKRMLGRGSKKKEA